ncbi:site-2 protease family protein [Candidatus Saccharibacteria bacterium]|jgi:Zn-dependent protease|nr:site-2 protease family protein [Candidatus Saccharibacteria bacterium]
MEDLLPVLVVYLIVILISAVAHEVMHGLVAHWLGDDTAKVSGRLSANPLKHLDPFLSVGLPMLLAFSSIVAGVRTPIFGGAKPVPINTARLKFGEFGMAIVAIAGPLTNLLLAFIFTGLFVKFGSSSSILSEFFQIGILVNLGFFAFNIIPFPPLDGSRILYSIAPESFKKIMHGLERYGLVLVLALVLLFSEQIGNFIGGISNFFFSIFLAILT